MKMKKYYYFLMAPLSMLMVMACSPDQYHQKGEYDDVYFTRNDRKKQPDQVPVTGADPIVATANSSQNTVDPALQERYTNQEEVVYFEEQGPRVQSADELNYADFMYDYEQGFLEYYSLPLDWDTDWSEQSFNELIATDYQFRLAWYDQYYKGNDWRMNAYLGNQNNLNASRSSFYGPSMAGTVLIPTYSNMFYNNIMYGDMFALQANPIGFYDPFWGGSNWRWSFNVGIGIGYNDPWGWNNNFWGWNRWNNPYGFGRNPGFNNTIIINNGGSETSVGNRPVTRSGRLSSTSVSSVANDSRNGAQVRARSQRAVRGETISNSSRNGRSSNLTRSRVASSAGRSTLRSRSDLTASTVNRARTDQTRISQGRTSSRVTRNRVNASRTSSGRSNAAVSRSTTRNSGFTRADVGRSSRSSTSRSRSSALTFDRTSSSSISRSVASRNSFTRRNSDGRSFSSNRSSASRGFNSSGRSSNSRSSFSRNSSSRSSSGFSRSSGSSRSSSSRSGSSVSSGSRSSGSSSSSRSSRSSSGSRGKN